MPMQTFPEALHHHITHTPDRVAVILLFAREPDLPITLSPDNYRLA
ncbi:MAG: hypothetical protein HUU38_21205 [Anaerolineales bacterium]|nr:hypothetical protein [Anaerolineales bacterium]